MRTAIWCVSAAAVLLLVGCKTKQPEAETKPAETAKVETPPPTAAPATAESKPPATAPSAAPAASAPPARAGNLLKPATLNEKAPEKYEVKFKTTRGDFTLMVKREWSPLAADRFYNLVKAHFYDNTAFFRVVPGFVVQFGISDRPAVPPRGNIRKYPMIPSLRRTSVERSVLRRRDRIRARRRYSLI